MIRNMKKGTLDFLTHTAIIQETFQGAAQRVCNFQVQFRGKYKNLAYMPF